MDSQQKLKIVRTNVGVAKLREYLKDKTLLTFDTETTGVISTSEVIGYSICAEPGVGWYVITAYWDVAAQELKYLETKDTAPDVMTDLVGKDIVMHNAVFDCAMVQNNYRVDLMPSLHSDTMVMAHLLDENRSVGLKELCEGFYGADARKEQTEMKESVARNGGELTKKNYELYKADADLIAKYGAKDAILTYNLFFELLPKLYDEQMDGFFYDDESMPLLRGPTYQLNTTGLKVDTNRLQTLKKELEIEAMQLKEFIHREIQPHIAAKYPATNKKNHFNIGSGNQLAWLLFEQLNNQFVKVSNAGADLCEAFEMKRPYQNSDKRYFIDIVKENKGAVWREKGKWCPKKKKKLGEAKVKDYWTYLSTDKLVLGTFSKKYKWVEALLKYKKVTKLLSTYVEGIQSRMQYGIIYPQFLQIGTTSGRYSSKAPNFQNLPRDDKRIKSCIIARPGKVFVGADYSQLEPRVFASYAQDERLMSCFAKGEDFYSVIGCTTYEKDGFNLIKNDKDPKFFGNAFPKLRQDSKTFGLAATYGTTAHKMAPVLEMEVPQAQAVIDDYFDKFPSVRNNVMLEAHKLVIKQGYVENLFGRKRRIPDAMSIKRIYKTTTHSELPYTARNLLNLAVNHRIQSTGASIVNRAAIQFLNLCKLYNIDAKIVLQVHDELVVECNEADAEIVKLLLKDAMENTVKLNGVDLVADPKIGKNLAELK